MTADFETRFARHSAESDLSFHLVSNPDTGANDFSNGAQLYFEEGPDWKPRGQMHIPARDLRAIGLMFLAAADIAEGKK